MATNAKIKIDETTQVLDGQITTPVVDRKTENAEIDVNEYIDRLIGVVKDDSDVEVNFGGLTTGKFLRIETNSPVMVKVGDVGATAMKVTSLLIWHGEFTALYLSGDGVADAVAKILIGGE
jgi:hypothetical protein